MMTLDSWRSPNLRKQIGEAVWLFALLANFADVSSVSVVPAAVDHGAAISDAELGAVLEVSAATVAKWRLKLRTAGLIDWRNAANNGRIFWIRAVATLPGAPKAALALNDSPAIFGRVN